jgi:hypothetical protein
MNKIVYQINNNNGKEYWGPRLWYLIHMISYSYPLTTNNKIRLDYYNYFLLTAEIIPCIYCKNHFLDSIKNKKLIYNLENRNQVVDWFKAQHNEINIINGSRVYQGFEVDALYKNTDFDNTKFNELVIYLLNKVKINELDKEVFLRWFLYTIKFFPDETTKNKIYIFIEHFDISKYNWKDYIILNNWIMRAINI